MTEFRRIEFDGWTVHTETGELSRNSQSARLQEQPLQVLMELLARPGELISREQLIARLWPKGVVDFDAGLNSVVRKLRIALQDDSESPRYIETVPRKGYRYIGPLPNSVPNNVPRNSVSSVTAQATNIADTAKQSPPAAASIPTIETQQYRSIWRQPRAYIYAAMAAAVLIAVVNIRKPSDSHTTSSVHSASATATQTDIPTIAVLPLTTPIADERSRSMADGFTAVLRDGLSAVNGLAVLSASSTDLSRGNDPVERGKHARVRYVVHGGMQQHGDDFEFDIKLVEVQSNQLRWSVKFYDPIVDTVAARNHIVKGIANSFKGLRGIEWVDFRGKESLAGKSPRENGS